VLVLVMMMVWWPFVVVVLVAVDVVGNKLNNEQTTVVCLWLMPRDEIFSHPANVGLSKKIYDL
jgi:hypothetical protein